MYFLVIFVGVFLFLSLVAWRSPWPVYAVDARMRRQDAGPGKQGPRGAGDRFARLLQGEHKEEMPCLSPVDCVRSGKCAGHCGCH
jgi:hypothetical protein